jgi:hypothetical protein
MSNEPLYFGHAADVSLGTTKYIPNALKTPMAPPKQKVASVLIILHRSPPTTDAGIVSFLVRILGSELKAFNGP